MSEEQVVEAVEEKTEDQSEPGRIVIEINEDSVKYDTNLPAAELTFWLELVRQKIFKAVIDGGGDS